jgi:hypothetical protein
MQDPMHRDVVRPLAEVQKRCIPKMLKTLDIRPFLLTVSFLLGENEEQKRRGQDAKTSTASSRQALRTTI